ncbi:hypothetical protein D9619_013732 [Psilocybe cf. subviscida]|uniref:Uncharacterized protein n=1 Tax=Psilocybe cf. subviscida TaxID=2480587 RepID=A0A8H5BH18_9AGAR|nr:hypothetical protein D9619_013732 [Psilocybe cf. subviscida]
MVSDASPASTGWQGFPMADNKMDLLRSFYNKDEVRSIVRFFLPIYYLGKSTMLLDKEGRCFAFRTAQIPFLQSGQELFHAATLLLLAAELVSQRAVEKHRLGLRGGHFPCIIGHHRQYTKKSELTEWHRSNMDRVNAFMKTEIIEHATRYVSRTVEIIFPGVAERMRASAKWQYGRWRIRPMFGLFYNLCVNGIFPTSRGSTASPTSISRMLSANPFQPPPSLWVVLWEAGVAIELPPWVILIYPSSLLHHFNVDALDFQFVMVDGTERPTRKTQPLLSMLMGAGAGHFDTLADAKRAHKKTTVSYPDSIKTALENYSYVYNTASSPPHVPM